MRLLYSYFLILHSIFSKYILLILSHASHKPTADKTNTAVLLQIEQEYPIQTLITKGKRNVCMQRFTLPYFFICKCTITFLLWLYHSYISEYNCVFIVQGFVVSSVTKYEYLWMVWYSKAIKLIRYQINDLNSTELNTTVELRGDLFFSSYMIKIKIHFYL